MLDARERRPPIRRQCKTCPLRPVGPVRNRRISSVSGVPGLHLVIARIRDVTFVVVIPSRLNSGQALAVDLHPKVSRTGFLRLYRRTRHRDAPCGCQLAARDPDGRCIPLGRHYGTAGGRLAVAVDLPLVRRVRDHGLSCGMGPHIAIVAQRPPTGGVGRAAIRLHRRGVHRDPCGRVQGGCTHLRGGNPRETGRSPPSTCPRRHR